MKNIVIISLCLVFLSCNDLLNSVPKDFLSPEEYYTNEEEIESALAGVYSTLKNGKTYASYMLGLMGLDADQGYNRNYNVQNTVAAYNVSTSDVYISGFWQELYAGIKRANMLLKNIEASEEIDAQRKSEVIGETLFLRAYFYFLLVQNFGDVPLVLEPLAGVSKNEYQVTRTPAIQVYNKILEDMETAADMVKDIEDVGHSGRVTKSAVWGILSRVCLYMAGDPINEKDKYVDARKWAKKVMELPIHKLNPSFEKVFINYAQDVYDIGESIWEVEFWGDGLGIYSSSTGKVGMHNGIFNTEDKEIGLSPCYISCTAYMYKVYKEGDLRRDWTVAPFRYYGSPAQKLIWSSSQLFNRNCGKFRREYEIVKPKNNGTTPQNFPLLRFSDVLLMFAEAENVINDGPTTEACEAINQVRRRGFGLNPNQANISVDLTEDLSYEEFLTELQDERSRELAFECLRKRDLVRWGIFLEKMKLRLNEANAHVTFSELYLAKNTFTNVSERDVLWPIPLHEMSINKALTQNKGW